MNKNRLFVIICVVFGIIATGVGAFIATQTDLLSNFSNTGIGIGIGAGVLVIGGAVGFLIYLSKSGKMMK